MCEDSINPLFPFHSKDRRFLRKSSTTIQCLVVATCTVPKGTPAEGTKPPSLCPAPPAYPHSLFKQRHLKDSIQIQHGYECELADLSG